MAKKPSIGNSIDLWDVINGMNKNLEDEQKQAAKKAKASNFQNLTAIFQKEMQDFIKTSNFKINKKYSSKELEQIDEAAWRKYQALYNEIFGKKLGRAQKTEFLLFWRGGKIDLWDPYGTEPFYLQGDIETNGVIGDTDSKKQVQVKKEGGSFSLGYTLSGLVHQTKIYSNIYSKDLAGVFNAYIHISTLEKMPAFDKDLVYSDPVKFVTEYLKLSVAHWFLFFIPRLNLWISLPHESLISFVQSFPQAWRLGYYQRSKSTYHAPYTQELWFDGFKSDKIGVFDVPLSIYSFVHSAYPQVFYEARGIIVGKQGLSHVIPTTAAYNQAEIRYYNERINQDFWDIHNSFFGPINY